jgi:putative ABC transport system substrate-binding protein
MVAGYFDAVLESMMKFAHVPAEKLGLHLVQFEAGGSWGRVPQSAIDAGAQAALVMTPFAYFGMRYAEEEIVRHSIERRFPLVFANVETVETGGLASYATRLDDNLRRAANLVARVLRGDRPADLPIDQAASFELAINLKTARAIGLKIPQALLLRADRVIE